MPSEFHSYMFGGSKKRQTLVQEKIIALTINSAFLEMILSRLVRLL